MEGRRVSQRHKKYNPLFILFLCLAAAVLVLLILSIVLGIRLSGANKKAKAAAAQITQLESEISQLQDDLAVLRDRTPSEQPEEQTEPSVDTPAVEPAAAVSASWLDLSGHNEFKIKPTKLLDGYTTYYTTAGVNLRAGPATSYDRITTVDYGTKVQVAAREGNWSFVKVGNRFGWLSSDYLSTKEPAPLPAATTTTTKTPTRTEATSGSLKTR